MPVETDETSATTLEEGTAEVMTEPSDNSVSVESESSESTGLDEATEEEMTESAQDDSSSESDDTVTATPIEE
jgi:hypothetical protein